jgi:hypothetical protein
VKRHQIVVEVDVPAAESGHEYDDAMRRAHATITGHLWRSPIPDDATLEVFGLVDPVDDDERDAVASTSSTPDSSPGSEGAA